MIEDFTKSWFANLHDMRASFEANHPEDYKQIVVRVVEMLGKGKVSTYGDLLPDPSRVHEIDDGDYQGTLLFVIGAQGYQPSEYWSVLVGYGSCSGCDTLQNIRDYENGAPREDQVKEYMTLALHIVQGLRKIGGEAV